MTRDNMTPATIYMGIDGGGSKCKARVQAARVEGVGIAGPANPFQNLEQARSSIVEAASLALADAGIAADKLSSVIAGVGLAGVNVPRFMALMQAWDHPFAEMYLTTDIHIACLSAHGGENGAVIVAGTGSVGYTCIDGRTASYGGHGFPFGDKGSGAWIGLEAIKAAMLALDGLGPPTLLLQGIEQQLDALGLDIADRMAGARTRDYAALAPMVLDYASQGDSVATAIIEDGVGYLSDMAERMRADGAQSICLLGGLSGKINQWMPPSLLECLVDARQEPDYGALLYARNCHQDSQQKTG